jgi:hypothetical protein
MATDIERLVVSLESRVTAFEKGMAKASGTATRTYGQLTAGSSRATARMEKDFERSSRSINRALATTSAKVGEFSKAFRGNLLGAFGAGFAGGAAASLLTELPRLFTATTRSIAAMRGEAAKAGVSFEAFQKLKYAADQNGVSVDGLVDGLKELQLRADEFVVTGGGSAAEAFERLGYGAEDLKRKLADPVALLDEILKRLGSVDKAAQIRIADELLGGTGGEEFLKFLADGSRGLRELTDEASRIGGVLDEEIGRRAVEIDRQFNRLATTIGTSLKGAIVSVAGELAYFAELLSTIETRSRSSIEGEIANRRKAIEDVQGSVMGPVSGTYVANQQAEIAKLQNELAGRAARTGASAPLELNIVGGSVDKLASVADDLEGSVRQMIADAAAAGHDLTVTSGKRSTEQQRVLWNAALAKYGSPAEARKHVAPPGSSMHEQGAAVDLTFGSQAGRQWVQSNMAAYGLSAPVPGERPLDGRHAHLELAGARGGGASERDEEAEAAKRQAEAIAGVMSALQFESEQLRRNDLQQKIAEEQRRAGVDAASAEGRAIAELVTQNHALVAAREAAAAAAERNTAAAEELNATGRDFAGTFAHAMKDGANAADALGQAFARLSDRLLDAGLDGLFGMGGAAGGSTGGGLMSMLSNVVGSLFAGGFASGGHIPAGMWGMTGENGPEPIFGGRTGVTVQPNGGGGRPVNMNFTLRVEGNGDKELLQRADLVARRAVEQGIASYDRTIDSRQARRRADTGQ